MNDLKRESVTVHFRFNEGMVKKVKTYSVTSWEMKDCVFWEMRRP